MVFEEENICYFLIKYHIALIKQVMVLLLLLLAKKVLPHVKQVLSGLQKIAVLFQ